MTWFQVDDNLAFHPKAIMAGNAALGMWVRAGSWSAHQLTDGFIPADMARSLGTPSQAQRLTDAGLWLPCGKGYEFHQWEDRQLSRKQVEQRRQKSLQRWQKWRDQHDG